MGSILPAQFFKNTPTNKTAISNGNAASGAERQQLSPTSTTEVERHFMSMLEEHDRLRASVLRAHAKPNVIS